MTIKILELLRKQPFYLIKIFLKSKNHLSKFLHVLKEMTIFPMTKMTYFLRKECAI